MNLRPNMMAAALAAGMALTLAGAAEPAPATVPDKTADKPAAAKAGEVAGIGAWTTDYPAALKVAKERQLPLLIQFTGSDWCIWCKRMEAACLSRPEFLEAMRGQCVLVVVDFPHTVPQSDALKAQNKALAAKFQKVSGLPSYTLVDGDGETPFWVLGATPAYCNPQGGAVKLIGDLKRFCAGTARSVEQAVKGLAPEKAVAYRAAAEEYRAVQLETYAWTGTARNREEAETKYNAFWNRLKVIEAKMAAAAKP
jgi:protein disulfide-isomerase